ncbi:MAG: cupin domain-containing protein [Pseudomonadales bacterium]|jgi:mannose-6-phosphate isomerase-like protein (cupin superfamily)|nr:cupin domain-containing protein [Pseudomonadales bacterium]
MADLFRTFSILAPDLGVTQRDFDERFYESLDEFDGFKDHLLIAAHAFDGDWPTWEMHPEGDELVVLLDGAAEMVLRGEDGDVVETLDAPGEYVVVPRGTWHTARIATAARMLFVTPGEGTRNETTPP